MKKEILNCLSWAVNKMATAHLYKEWSTDFKVKELDDTYEKMYEALRPHIDFTKLTREEAKELRFQRWSDEQPDLFLFPLWLLPLIPDGMAVYHIDDNEPVIYQKDTADNDIRFGCVSYGIMIKE